MLDQGHPRLRIEASGAEFGNQLGLGQEALGLARELGEHERLPGHRLVFGTKRGAGEREDEEARPRSGDPRRVGNRPAELGRGPCEVPDPVGDEEIEIVEASSQVKVPTKRAAEEDQEKRVQRPGRYILHSVLFPNWMQTPIIVSPQINWYYDQTNAEGHYRVEALPAGTYTYKVTATSLAGSDVPVQTYTAGIVDGVSFQGGTVILKSGTLTFPLDNVVEVEQAPAGAAALAAASSARIIPSPTE